MGGFFAASHPHARRAGSNRRAVHFQAGHSLPPLLWCWCHRASKVHTGSLSWCEEEYGGAGDEE